MTWEDDGFVNAMTRDHRPVGEDMIKQKTDKHMYRKYDPV